MERHKNDTNEWRSVQLPEELAKIVEESRTLVIFGLEESEDDEHIRMGGYNLRTSDLLPITQGWYEFFKNRADLLLARMGQSRQILARLNERMLEQSSLVEKHLLDDFQDADETDKEATLDQAVKTLADAVACLRSLDMLEWDADDPLNGLKVKEISDAQIPLDFPDPDPADAGGSTSGGSEH